MTPLRFVAPFRPLPLESALHQQCADFDWLAALQMLAHSVADSHPGADFRAVTDVDTTLPVPMLRYATQERRLMLWTLDACAAYLASDDFDRDTIMLDVDQLVLGDLRRWLPAADLGILIRPTVKHDRDHRPLGQPILNGVQFWPVAAKDRLAAFYRRVLDVARTLPDEWIRWGADTEALRLLLTPLTVGTWMREGLSVALIDAQGVIEALSSESMECFRKRGHFKPVTRPVLDFRYLRKRWMPVVYQQLFAHSAVLA